MEHLAQMYTELLKTYPWMAAALPLWLAGMGTIVLRSLPQRIMRLFRKFCLVTLSIDSAGGTGIERQYQALQDWFEERGSLKSVRNLMWAPNYYEVIVKLHPGLGRFMFMYKGRIGWFTKVKVDSQSGSESFTYTISVTLLSRKRELMDQLVEDFRWRYRPSRPMIYSVKPGSSDWKRQKVLTERTLESVILNDGQLETIRDRIQHFIDNRKWYFANGVPYRLVILIHGPPGTGKTSIIRALASHFGYSVAPLASCIDKDFKGLVDGVDPKTFLVLEDFDSYSNLLMPEFQPETISANEVTKSTFLQTIDGLDLLDGQIIFMTTNHLNRIDTAVYRDERVNVRYELGLLNSDAVRRYIEMRFPDETAHRSMKFQPIIGASLQKAYVANHDSYQGFLSCIPVENPDTESEPSQQETV